MEIHWTHTNWLKDGDKQEIEERLQALAAQGHNDLIDVHILGNPSRHRGHTSHEVRITCEARGREIVAVCTSERMDRALHDALESFKQQVRRMRSKRHDHHGGDRVAERGDRRTH